MQRESDANIIETISMIILILTLLNFESKSF